MVLLASHIALITRIPPPRNYTSSTPTVGISPLAALLFIVFSNAPSPSSAPSRDPPFQYFVADPTSSTARVDPSTISSVSHPITSSDQSQSTTLPPTMTSTTMTATVASISASLSTPSSSAPETSTGFSFMSSSAHSVTSVSSSIVNATTFPPTSSLQSSTSPIPATSPSPTTRSSSATTSPSPTLASSPSTSTPPLTSDTYSSVISSPSPSSSSSSQTSPMRTDTPVTTVLASTTIFITSTNSVGEVVTGAPAVVTEVITTTGSGGIATTVTQAIVNPTLAQDNNSATRESSFFNNTGAVVGVFVIVGLASASILLWILFAIRKRQRMRRIEQDDALEAAVVAAGLSRAPLDDDNEDGSPSQELRRLSLGIGQRGSLLGHSLGGSGSLLTSARTSEPFDDLARNSSHADHPADYHPSGRSEGYAPARTTSPTQKIERPMPTGPNDYGSSRERKSSYGHTPTYSAGSFEPLLANYIQNTSEQDSSIPPTPLPRDSQHLIDVSPRRSASSLPQDPHRYSSDESADDRVESGIRRQDSSGSFGSVPLRDGEEHARTVLVVRNLPDSPSEHSD